MKDKKRLKSSSNYVRLKCLIFHLWKVNIMYQPGSWIRSWTQKKDLSGKTGNIWIRLVNSIQSTLTSWFSIIVLRLCELLAVNVVGRNVYMKAPHYPYHSSVSLKSFSQKEKESDHKLSFFTEFFSLVTTISWLLGDLSEALFVKCSV